MNVSRQGKQRLWIAAISFASTGGLIAAAWAQAPAPPTPPASQEQSTAETPPGTPQSDTQPGQPDQARQSNQQQDRNAHDDQHNQPNQQDQRPELGVRTARSQTRGVVIIEVRPGSTAERAGLRPGDYILSLEQQPIDSADDLVRLLRDRSVGDNLRIDIWRDGQNQQLTAQLQPVSQQSGGRNNDRGRMGQMNREADPQAAWIGIWLDQDESAQASQDERDGQRGQHDRDGAIVRRVFPSGPAARAGLRDGDRVTAVNDKKIDGPEQLVDQMSSLKPGDTAEFTVNRNNNERKIKVTVGRRSDFAGFGMQPVQEREGSERGFGDFNGGSVPGHAMMLEQNRRFAEQHERMEQMIIQLREEIRQLRADLGKDKQRAAQNDNQPGTSTATPARP